jgi:acetyl-CoA acetyltransferase
MKEVFVVEAARTAVARAGKQSWFTNVRADDLSAIVIKDLRRRIGLGEDKEKHLPGPKEVKSHRFTMFLPKGSQYL